MTFWPDYYRDLESDSGSESDGHDSDEHSSDDCESDEHNSDDYESDHDRDGDSAIEIAPMITFHCNWTDYDGIIPKMTNFVPEDKKQKFLLPVHRDEEQHERHESVIRELARTLPKRLRALYHTQYKHVIYHALVQLFARPIACAIVDKI
jgi:hypothetical protein